MNKFDKNRRRVKQCPCGKSNSNGKFAPYEGHEAFGFCHSCCKAFMPSQDTLVPSYKLSKPKKVSYIADSIFKQSLTNREDNKFYQFLARKFNNRQADEIFERYHVGTSVRWKGATVFWQLDKLNRARTGKVMLYNPISGRRITNCNDWAHAILCRTQKLVDFNLKQCLFGLHLVNVNKENKPIAIVESEKTACIMSHISPKYFWLASGGFGGLNYDKIKPLKKHRILLFPDLDIEGEDSPYETWSAMALDLNDHGYNISVSDVLEERATLQHREEKWDVADFFL